MDILELIEYFHDPHRIALLTLGVATLSVLMPITLRIVDYFRHRHRRRRITKTIRNIIHDGLRKICADDSLPAPHPLDGHHPARDHCFKEMIFDLGVVLHAHSSDLPLKIQKDIKYLCTITYNSVRAEVNTFGHQGKEFYERHVVEKVRKFDWLELDE